ncbi:MAG: radical SAM protein [Candidatus Lokiarchaeota archaeon]|nr:radical SAM protein [Candidatus Lokiarchaeota archaeon]
MTNYQKILEEKTELLCRGLFLDDSLMDHYKLQGIEIDFGRKGGAGPSGGRYFILEDDETVVNVALWKDKNRSALLLGECEEGYFSVFDEKSKKEYNKIKLVKNPLYYDARYKTSDGIEMKKIALVHGVDCLATTIYQKCAHWACGEACKFCGIQISLASGATTPEKNPEQLCEVISIAKRENRCSHVTLTSGTEGSPDKGANRYISMLKGIRKRFKDLPLHVQIEPISRTLLQDLKDSGADTIGIHIEIIDELIRKIVTPGKSKIPLKKFKESWSEAVEIFGKNQVETFLLTGFGESRFDFLKNVEDIIITGVIPFILPVRSVPGSKDLMPTTNYLALLEIYTKVAQLMKDYGINPLENKAGCVKCGGCSAIKEAYKAI